jgi:hypothetical protein
MHKDLPPPLHLIVIGGFEPLVKAFFGASKLEREVEAGLWLFTREKHSMSSTGDRYDTNETRSFGPRCRRW